jgi:hypothetical protein
MRSRPLVVLLALVLGASGTAVASAQSAGASLSGTVTSESGQALAGVCVDVFGEQGFASTVTGPDGRWSAELPAGEYAVGFNVCQEPRPGFAGELYDDVSGFNQRPTPVVLTDGRATTGIDAVLMPGATIAGRVTADGDGRALEGICVTAFSERNGSVGSARSGADGGYAITTLRGGEYQLLFDDCRAPFTFLSEAYDDVPADGGFSGPPGGPGRQPTPVTVADRGQVSGIDAGLAEGGSVAGTVTALHTGEPVDGVCVALLPADGDVQELGPGGVGFTGGLPDGGAARGEYLVPSVEPGSYLLGINPSEFCGDDGYSTAWFDGAASRADADPLEVRAADVLTGFDVVVAPRPSTSAACGLFGPPGKPFTFTDVPDGNLHAPAIDCIALRQVASGRGDGTFGPADDVRRDQLASFVARALASLGVELPDRPADAFRDDQGSVHERSIDQLAALGVVEGVAPGRYEPLGTMSRAQMATFLVRAYEAASGNDLRLVRDVFADDAGSVHEGSINRAATAGLAVGRTTTSYRTLDTVSREQMATFLARLLDRVQRDSSQGMLFRACRCPVRCPPSWRSVVLRRQRRQRTCSLVLAEHGDAPAVALLAAVGRREERLHHGQRRRLVVHAAPRLTDVGVVVLTAQPGRLHRPREGAAHALHLVGRDGLAVARAAQHDAQAGRAPRPPPRAARRTNGG